MRGTLFPFVVSKAVPCRCVGLDIKVEWTYADDSSALMFFYKINGGRIAFLKETKFLL